MRLIVLLRIAALGLVVTACGRGDGASTLQDNAVNLPNFHQVNAVLYRSGRPAQGDIAALKSLGVKSVVDLEDKTSVVEEERGWVEGAGMTFYNVPMSGLLKPTLSEINQALAYLADATNQPVLVHCEHGSDRTGIVVGAYHIHVDGWTADQAISDMRQPEYGHSHLLYWWDDVLNEVQ